jgi:drug/metabolite transporter (DMT)-like permease
VGKEVAISTEALVLALAASAAWGIGMTAATPAIRYVDRLTYLVVRWGLVALFAFIYALVSGKLAAPAPGPAALAVLAGVVDATAGGFLYLLAIERASTHQATTLSNTAPLWGVLGAVVLLGEPLRWNLALAAGLVLVGAYFLVERNDTTGRRSGGSGILFALLTGILWGVAETVPAKLALDQGLSPEMLLLLFACAGCLGAVVLLPFLRRRIPVRVERRGFFFVALSGIAGAGLGWLLWLKSLELAPASVVAPVRGSTLLFCLVYSVVFLRERPSPRALVGVVLAIGAVLLVSFGS